MRVLHVVARLGREAGGPARSVQGLVAALCKRGVDAWILPLDNADPWIPGVRKMGIGGGGRWRWTEELAKFDLVHIHGLWDWRLHKVAVMCRKAGVKYVIAPRGMLEPWSLSQKWIKKRIARWLYQDRDLHCAAALQATAESEAAQFRALGFKNRIIVAPNGVNVPEGNVGLGRRSRSTVEFANSSIVGRRALFVSRMHPKKGVLELVESWARVKKEVEKRGGGGQWCVELVYTVSGETEKAYEQKVKDRIRKLGMTYSEGDHSTVDLDLKPRPDFILTGPLDDTEKWNAYARADLFVLPTYSENFGIVVAEALWAGIPVITTKGTPWAELEERKCGWWVDLPEAGKEVKVKGEGEQWNALDDALREAIKQSNNPNNQTILHEMGARGHQLIAERYTWAAVCDKMVRGYEEAGFGQEL